MNVGSGIKIKNKAKEKFQIEDVIPQSKNDDQIIVIVLRTKYSTSALYQYSFDVNKSIKDKVKNEDNKFEK